MHMVGPHLTTTKYGNKGGKKLPNTTAARQATAKHDSWLKQRGIHPSQLELAKAFKGEYRSEFPDLKVKDTAPLSNNIPGGGFRNGIMDNLNKETTEVRNEILEKANRVDMAYNKGPYVYHSPGTDLTQIGTRSRRG